MEERREPIRSLYEDEPDLEDDVDRFVITLAERVDTLQDAELGEAFVELDALADSLANDAQRCGYPTLGDVALQICDACKERKSEALQELLVELTELSRRVRLGHRGAAG
jgi:hypothetical protein